MNTPDDWKTTAKISNTERGEHWRKVFGGDRVPIKTVIPHWCMLPRLDGPQLVYDLDLRVITAEQRERLINSIAQKFEMTPAFVATEIEKVGVPILADDVTVSTTDSGLMMDIVITAQEMEDTGALPEDGGDWSAGLSEEEEYDLAIRYGWDDDIDFEEDW